MALWTLDQLEERVRERADMVYSEFVSQDEIRRFISASYADFYDLVTKAYADHYMEDPVEFTISSGNTFTLGSTFYKLIGVDFLDSGEWIEVRSFNFNERNANASGTNGRYHPLLKYRITGSKLRFIPVDQATGTYRYWFIPLAEPLVNGDDEMDGYNGWEEYIVIDSAIKCLLKEETQVKELLLLRQEWKEKIAENAQNRDAGESQKVTDVYAGQDYFLDRR